MVVQHNLTAMNSNRMLGITTGAQSKSTEKLSSGYKINRAADDAAGLSISEKMRKQIRGLTQASSNAQDGISAVQTAEGALTEVHDMLQRMNELAVKAANGTNSVDDREYIQNEIDQLVTEIDRVAETTKFNETYLLKGDMKNTQKTVGYVGGEVTEASVAIKDGVKLYRAGGTTELTEAEILEALKNNEKLYTDPAAAPQTKAKNVYTAGSLNWDQTGVFAGTAGSGTYTQVTNANWDQFFDFDGEKVTLKEGMGAYNNATGSQDKSADFPNSAGTYVTITEAKYDTNGDGTALDKLYRLGETEALSEADAKKAMRDGETLYSDPAVPQTEAVADDDYVYTPASGGPSVVFGEGVTELYDEDGNALTEEQATDILRAGGKLYKAAEQKNAATGDYSYKVSITLNTGGSGLFIDPEDNGTRAEITAANWTDYLTYDEGTGQFSLKAEYASAKLYDEDSSGNDITTDITGASSTKITYVETWGADYATFPAEGLYAEGGTEAMDEAAVKAAVKAAVEAGEPAPTFYTDPATPVEAKESTDYTLDVPALYDANGNKISANGLDSFIEIQADGSYKMKEGKELYTDPNGKNFFDPTNKEAAAKYLQTNETTAALDLSLHVGADATKNNQIEMKIEAMSAKGIGVAGLKVNGSDDTNALDAIETIKAAIQRVSTQRSALGAIQNRLEHTINNLDNVVENTTSAESQIRDTDMATEMVKYSNNNILAQAGQAMLAQSNQANQGVLSLLG